MSLEYLKAATKVRAADSTETRDTVAAMLNEIEAGREDAVRRFCRELDGYTGDVVITRAEIDEARTYLSEIVKEDIRFAHDRVRDFASAQLATLKEFETELIAGVTAGHRLVPVGAAGCYVPGGRYAHAASAIMSVCTAKVAGVANVIATSPAHEDRKPHPAILYAMDLSGADTILAIGGVQGVATLAFGLFTDIPADIIVGPGNKYVAEAKRLLFGRTGIDVIAGPTETMVVSDESADPGLVAADLVGQLEHGAESPVWLLTMSRRCAEDVLERLPELIESLPVSARAVAEIAWQEHGEIMLVDSREEACRVCDQYAPEHLHIHASDLDWWLANLSNYGSLFLGEETTVAYGDKCAGPNHILPTMGAGRYSGGLNVSKFIKTLTYQRMTQHATRTLAPVAARISRLEGMEGHARSCDIRLSKYFPSESFDLGVPVKT